MAFQRFNPENDVVENQRTTISSGLWTGGSSTLTGFFTQSSNGNITGSVLELYNVDPNTDTSAETQIAVGYANIHGSGSAGNTTKLTTGGRQQLYIDNLEMLSWHQTQMNFHLQVQLHQVMTSTLSRSKEQDKEKRLTQVIGNYN